MKTRILSTLALAAIAGASVSAISIRGSAPSLSSKTPSAKVVGDYVEARTASVFAGACHYNAELVTTGRDAVMAWKFASGSWNGVDISGQRAVAAVTSESSLGDTAAARKCDLVIDSSASPAQVSAIMSLIQTQAGSNIGQIVTMHRAPISFNDDNHSYTVDAKGFATMSVQPMPDDACCAMPSLVWFAPLSPIQGRKVGYTEVASYSGHVADPWQRVQENSAFYGSFSY